MNKIITLKNRIYSDYFMKDRFEEYENMIRSLLEDGFEFAKIEDFDKLDFSTKKYIFLRHDIDSETEIARKFFQIENKYNVKSTYYFRLCTLDIPLMIQMYKANVEIGYHYEELATFAKENKIKQGEVIKEKLGEIQADFVRNFTDLQKLMGFKIKTVASHGDWKNRQLKLTNQVICTKEILHKLNITHEAYDIEDDIDFRIADRSYPDFWYPQKPENILLNKDIHSGLFLIHPRQWCSNPKSRIKQDIERMTFK